MRISIIGAATIALLSTTALVSAQQTQEPRGGQPAMKEQGVTPGSSGGAAEKGDVQRDRAAEPKDKAGDTKRSAEPKDRAGDAKRSAEPKDKAGDGKRSAEPKDKAGDRDRTAEPKDKAGDTKRSAEPKDKAGDRERAAEPKDKAGDTKRSAEPKDKAGDRSKDQAQSKDGQRDGARVSLSQDQRTQVRTRLASHREARVSNVTFSINIGTRVPRDFRGHSIPNDVLVIVPQYRGYRYFIYEERVVIVHPTRYVIVEVIDLDSGPRRGGPVTAMLTLSAQQRMLIVERIPRDRVTRDLRVELALGAEVPSTVELYEFPDEVLVEVPSLRPYRYVVLERRVAVIDPSNRAVIEVLDR
ncbi:MAG: DUF1236 domain-containing protein [Hyphomicrobiaceae bacterium]